MSDTYRMMKYPAHRGQLRLKTWRYVIPPSGPDDPVWVQRAADFWRTQAETFGIKFHDDVHIMVDYALGIVTTACHVDRVLPGKRDKYYRTPRVAAELGEL